MNLSLFIIIPIATVAIIALSRNNFQARLVALISSLLQLILSFLLLGSYYVQRQQGNRAQFLFEQQYTWYESLKIQYYVGVDGISISMIMLTALVVLAGVLVSWRNTLLARDFFIQLMLLSAGAYGFFISLDLFTMFFFLETAVIPKYLLIGIWGSGRKEYSANKLALMLMGGSALIFIGLLGLYFNNGTGLTFSLTNLAQMRIPLDVQKFFFPFLFLGFGVYTALFPFHTWVPDGHSSAPTAGSMFLAGISMKLGGYGCLRVAAYLMPQAAQYYSPIIILLATIAIIYGAFATMQQTDLKYINAYSSVSHCGFVLLGIGMLTKTAIAGSVMQMVSHGLMTALFFAAIGMLYERTHTRAVRQLGGLLKVMPFIGTVFFIAGLCSLGLPGFSGFVSEMTVFVGAWQREELFYRLATVLACASIVVTAVYILRALGASLMGPVLNSNFNQLNDARWNERLAAFILITGIVLIGVAPFLLLNLIEPDSLFIYSRFINSN